MSVINNHDPSTSLFLYYAPHIALNYALKGGKFSDWQGGVRVNAFVLGVYISFRESGQKIDGYIHLAD